MARKNRSRGDDPLNPAGATPEALLATLLVRCTFPAGSGPLDCAVSGGADSAALLILATATGRPVHAFHVDHGIRQGSAAEAAVVERLARRFGARFSALRCTVPPGSDLEARARLARHAALPPGVLFGHTMDDLAETVLQRLMRGTGPTGLAAMTPAAHPILALRRSETLTLCRAFAIETVDDPSNRDPRFDRSRIRHELLPLMDDIARRDVVPLLARYATLSGQQTAYIDSLAAAVDPTDAPALATAPGVLATAALRRWWLRTTGLGYPPDAAALERVMAVARGEARACDVTAGWSVQRSRQRLRLVHTPPNGPGPRPED